MLVYFLAKLLSTSSYPGGFLVWGGAFKMGSDITAVVWRKVLLVFLMIFELGPYSLVLNRRSVVLEDKLSFF